MKLSKFISKPKDITQGWLKYLFKDEAVEAFAMPRALICEKCKDRTLGFCDKCGCFIGAKVRLKKESCKKGLWKEVL